MERELYLSENGLAKLKEELSNLKRRRREVAERIRLAREFGDLSENSEYEDARNEQSFVEGRIEDLIDMISRARVIKRNGNGEKAGLGSVVTLEDGKEQFTYELVGANESDPANGKISVESPIGYCVLGKSKGEEVEINTPNGKTTYKIVSIK